MPAEQEIVHWYNQIPDLVNGDIPDDYPNTPDDYPANRITELRDLLDRLCNDIGNITYDISHNIVHIIMSDSNRTTYSFGLRTWLTDEREVKRYLREWFPSFNIPYTMGGIANYIHSTTPTQEIIMDYARNHFDNLERRTTHSINVIPIEPHPRNPYNDRIIETLTQVANDLDTQLYYAILDTHVIIEDRSFSPVYSLSLTLDIFEMMALPIVELSRRIRMEREVRNLPNSVTRVIESKDTPSTCTGKEEAPYTNYLDVI